MVNDKVFEEAGGTVLKTVKCGQNEDESEEEVGAQTIDDGEHIVITFS